MFNSYGTNYQRVDPIPKWDGLLLDLPMNEHLDPGSHRVIESSGLDWLDLFTLENSYFQGPTVNLMDWIYHI
jgi:hypothetical protein